MLFCYCTDCIGSLIPRWKNYLSHWIVDIYLFKNFAVFKYPTCKVYNVPSCSTQKSQKKSLSSSLKICPPHKCSSRFALHRSKNNYRDCLIKTFGPVSLWTLAYSNCVQIIQHFISVTRNIAGRKGSIAAYLCKSLFRITANQISWRYQSHIFI